MSILYVKGGDEGNYSFLRGFSLSYEIIEWLGVDRPRQDNQIFSRREMSINTN